MTEEKQEKPKQINIYCKLCKTPVFVTDDSKNPVETAMLIGGILMKHLNEEHKECYESVVKRTYNIFDEYITPNLKDIEKMFKKEDLR